MEIILASASPRRQSLLKMLGLEFKTEPADVDETMDKSLPIEEEITRISRKKAEAAAAKHDESAIIIAADTVVVYNGRVLGKPADEDTAFSMLKQLSGGCHRVITAVTVQTGDNVQSESAETLVYFRQLSDREIRAYIKTKEPMDKAGAYGIQELGALFVRRIEGDFYNVVGLPLVLLSKMLENCGVMLL